jgi:hypothetical protein
VSYTSRGIDRPLGADGRPPLLITARSGVLAGADVVDLLRKVTTLL